MKSKLKAILTLLAVFAVCIGLAACGRKTVLTEYEAKGYLISVTYNANGGNFMGRKGVTLIDMFNPDSSLFPADEDGVIRISLTEPTDKSRITGSLTSVALHMADHFFAGWYRTRTIKTVTVNGEEKIVDEFGKIIEEKDGKYYYPLEEGQETQAEATPGYNYSDRWDFETDKIEYTPGQGKLSMTLYAGWVPYYEFEYYAQNDNGEWEIYGKNTLFDYKLAVADGSVEADHRNIWIPRYVDGAMNYEHEYENRDKFVFPKINGKTFLKAYSDESLSEASEITDSFTHEGSIDIETATPVNRVQKIYVTFEDGEIYKITAAEQFAANFNAEGIFEIYNDLDFTSLKWPNYPVQTFKGKIIGMGGEKKFSNINAVFSSQSETGGLFGTISGEAIIKDINFENVTVSFSKQDRNVLSETRFGLFTGMVEDGAEISGVTVSGTMRLNIYLLGSYDVNLVANGDTSGITAGDINLVIFGTKLLNGYSYYIDPDGVTVSEGGSVNLSFSPNLTKDEAEYAINY
ncbi:MAG: hypothetical protein J6Z34_01650 [Clostridia bacterium]|nr:hypothetical protein [Clostridia bacterium]